jgi:hypothetical protein
VTGSYGSRRSSQANDRAEGPGRPGTGWRRPQVAFTYVDDVAEQDHKPYDVHKDPDLLVHWFEAGRAAARKLLDEERRPPLPQSDETGCSAWVDTLIAELRRAVEDTDLWRALWDDESRKPRAEKIVQAIADDALSIPVLSTIR